MPAGAIVDRLVTPANTLSTHPAILTRAGRPAVCYTTCRRTTRTGPAHCLAEALATAMLLLTILGIRRSMASAVPFAVGLVITAGDWFTASTSFANTAVTLARAFTTRFSGIAPGDVAGFALAQIFGAALAAILWRWFAREGGIAYSAPRHDIVPSEGR